MTESSSTFRNIKLEVNDLTGYSVITNDQLEDSAFDVASIVTDDMRSALLAKEDREFLVGNGDNGPIGLLYAGAKLSIASRNTTNKIKLADVIAMEAKLYAPFHKNAVWICSQSASAEIALIQTSVNAMAYSDTLANGGFPMLRGKPVLISENLPSLGTEGDLILVDLSQYFVGSKRDVVISFSDHYRFLNNETAYRAILRTDGRNGLNTYLTLANSETVSNIVTIPA